MRLKILAALFYCGLLQSCGNDGSDGDIIEGSWLSQCISVDTSTFDFFGQPITVSSEDSFSFEQTTTYKNNNITSTINTYSDINCQTRAAIDVSGLFASEAKAVFYSIGDEVLTDNGVEATQIDLIRSDGKVEEQIFAIIDGGSTLIFGDTNVSVLIACGLIDDVGLSSPLVDSTAECVRPTELDFEQVSTKVVN